MVKCFFVHGCQEKNLLQRKCIARCMLGKERGFHIIFTFARRYNVVQHGSCCCEKRTNLGLVRRLGDKNKHSHTNVEDNVVSIKSF